MELGKQIRMYIQKQREIGKRPYQKILLVIGSAMIAFVACILIGFLMHIFLTYSL